MLTQDELLAEIDRLKFQNYELKNKLSERTFSLENSVKYMRSLLDLAAGYIFVVDRNEIIDGNQRFLLELGYATLEEVQADIIDAYEVSEDERTLCSELLYDSDWLRFLLINNERIFRIKLKRENTLYNFEIYAKSLLYKTGVSDLVYMQRNYVVVCLNEISRLLYEVEKNRQKDHILIRQSRLAAMGEMIASIAHQWRQPLNALAALNQNIAFKLKKGNLSQEYISDTINKELELVKFLSETIDTFKNFFSPQKEKICFSLQETLNSAVMFAKTAFSKNSIEYTIIGDESIMMLGYRNEFIQAVLNILQNAKDVLDSRFLEQKRVTITISKYGNKAIISIEDNGGGIDDRVIEKVFDPYFTTKGGVGTGIGLYMTKMIIEQSLNGEIIAKNGKDGAVFEISLPLE